MTLQKVNQFLREVQLCRDKIPDFNEYPFSLEAVKSLYGLQFHPKVTFIVGENGTGKSTILEAIAVAYGLNPEGGTRNFTFSTRNTHSNLNEYLRLIKGIKRPEDSFFLRAESFYNVASNIEELDREGMGPRIIDSYGGRSLHAQSHGESFFSVILHKFKGRSLYILDEPEAALSPARQMAMISRIHELVNENSQFIIATHSPILMAYPDSIIYEIKDGLKIVNYKETEHYLLMRDFINKPEKLLQILME